MAKICKHDVGICDKSSPELIRVAHGAIYAKEKKKEEAVANKAEHAGKSFGISSFDFEDEGSRRGSTTSLASANVIGSGRSSFFVP